MEEKKADKKIIIFYFCLIAGSASFLFFQTQKEKLSGQTASAQINQSSNYTAKDVPVPEKEPVLITRKPGSFDFESKAGAALSILVPDEDGDINRGKILFKKNAEKKLPIASVSKLISATVAIDSYEMGDRIKISQDALNTEGDGGRLNLDEELTVNNLIHIMLIESSNDAAEALAEKMGRENFVSLMNEKAAEIGMESSFFVNPHGLDQYGLAPNASSAMDLAKLMVHIQKNYPLIGETLSSKDYSLVSPDGNSTHYLVNTNVLLYQPETLWGKTGYTKSANGCIVNLIRPDENKDYLIVNVILGADDRFYEMQKMSNWVDNSYIWQ